MVGAAPRPLPATDMLVTWLTADPAGVLADLRPDDPDATGRTVLRLATGFELRVEKAVAGTDERLLADRPPTHGLAEPLPAIGWGTVDAERIAAEWGVTLERAPNDEALGAYAWRVPGVIPATLLLEPVTEGRLAAALARLDEGPVALYLPRPDGADGPATVGTPLGRGTLLAARRRWGPFVLLVASRRGLPSPT